MSSNVLPRGYKNIYKKTSLEVPRLFDNNSPSFLCLPFVIKWLINKYRRGRVAAYFLHRFVFICLLNKHRQGFVVIIGESTAKVGNVDLCLR